jgi:hypothetical protein
VFVSLLQYLQILECVIINIHLSTLTLCRLGGVGVSVLATGPKGRGFEPDQGDGFLRAMKIGNTPSFRWKIKPEVPCSKILRHVASITVQYFYTFGSRLSNGNFVPKY